MTILARAISQSHDLMLDSTDQNPGWSLLSDIGADALRALRAAQRVLPFAATSIKAPGKDAA